MGTIPVAKTVVEEQTGKLFGELWTHYDEELFQQSVALFEKRWVANGEDPEFFRGKHCLDVGCGGGRFCIAMAKMGAVSVKGVDVSPTGLEDARMRVAREGLANVAFEEASALSLPFADGQFDFVCCSGVLHHTAGVERGLREIHRVLKPGGSVYLLLYGSGGMFWPSNYVLRAFAGLLGQEALRRSAAAAEYPPNKRKSVLDDLFVPILETYTSDRVGQLLRDSGFPQWRTWDAARMDHEGDAGAMLGEMETRLRLWEAAESTASGQAASVLARHGADLCKSVIRAIRNLIDLHQGGQISEQELRDAVIGHGHHRLIATRS